MQCCYDSFTIIVHIYVVVLRLHTFIINTPAHYLYYLSLSFTLHFFSLPSLINCHSLHYPCPMPGTWEEKNVTSWAREQLDLLLRMTVHELPSSQPGKVSLLDE